MSVYIKGMEMPTNCYECPCNKDDGFGFFTCGVTKSECDIGLPSDCPLIPVPEHGDLIDRDKLEKDIDNYIGGEESRSRFHHWVQVQSVVIPGNKKEQT